MTSCIKRIVALFLFALLVLPATVAGCGAYPGEESGDEWQEADIGEAEQLVCAGQYPAGPASYSDCASCKAAVAAFASAALPKTCGCEVFESDTCEIYREAVQKNYDKCSTLYQPCDTRCDKCKSDCRRCVGGLYSCNFNDCIAGCNTSVCRAN